MSAATNEPKVVDPPSVEAELDGQEIPPAVDAEKSTLAGQPDNAGDNDQVASPKKEGGKKPILIIAAILAVCAAAGGLYFTQVFLPSQSYAQADTLLSEGKYEEAKQAFSDLAGYRDSAERMLECDYQMAVDLYNKGKYKDAVATFSTIPEYGDSMSYVYSTFKKLAGQDYVDKAALGLKYMTNYITSQANAAKSFAFSFYGSSETEGTWSPDLYEANLVSMQSTASELSAMKTEVDRVFTKSILESCKDDNLKNAYDKFKSLHSSTTSILTTQKAMTYITDMMSGSRSNMSSDVAAAESAMQAYTRTIDQLK